ncbi:MAG: OadG family protein [Desulfobacterales bacterium]|nr:OadG family protein [Desulfobacterales bacterium]
MWQEALNVAAIGFSVVFVSLGVLAVSVRLMSLFFRQGEKKAKGVEP